MKPLKIALSALCLTSLVGCGTSVQESLKVNPDLKTNIGQAKRVVVLPFADYSEGDNIETAYRRNLFVSENLTDRFVQNGFSTPVQEDVFRYLINRNIINVVAYSENTSKSLEYELQKEWSPEMKRMLEPYRHMSGSKVARNAALDSPGTLGLDQAQVSLLGQNFAADYVVRGSIIQYKTRKDPSWAPWKKGIVSFVTGVTNKLAFGQARSDSYDELGNMVTGGALGAMYGSASDNWPYNRSGKSILGTSGGRSGNSIVWGAIGTGLGNVAYNTGDIPQAVVQLRMSVQDAYNGEVVWTNRIDVKVSPQSVLADYQYDALFEGATEQAIKVLMDDFLYTLNPGAQMQARDKEANLKKRGAARR